MIKALRALGIAALLFIPTYIALFMYATISEAPVKTSSVTSMEMTSPDGTVYSFSSENDREAEFIDFFLELNESAKNASSLPSDLKNTEHYTIMYSSYGEKWEYAYYFSQTKPSNSYYVDHNGNVYRINAKDTITFLDSEYSKALYGSSALPPVLTVGTAEVLPSEFSWNYYTYSSVAHSVTVPTSDEMQNMQLSFLSVPISFDRRPEQATVEITNEQSESVFSGTLDGYIADNPLSYLIKADTKLTVSINASWESNTSAGYSGHAKYSFTVDCIFDPPAQFWLGEDAIESGEFVVISGMNIDNISAITFSSSPAIDFTPTFYSDGDFVRALVPIKDDLGLSLQNVTLILTYDGAETTLELFVKESSLPRKTRTHISNGKFDLKLRDDKVLSDFTDFVTSARSSSTYYFSDYFLFSAEHGTRAEFMDTVTNKKGLTYTSGGLALLTYKNGELYAVNSGMVVAVGETEYGGNTVVVDHGLGLRSVYYCMSTPMVSTGDFVTRGEVIGKGASSADGFTDNSTSYIELWVEDTPVSYFPLLEGGRTSMVVFGDQE